MQTATLKLTIHCDGLGTHEIIIKGGFTELYQPVRLGSTIEFRLIGASIIDEPAPKTEELTQLNLANLHRLIGMTLPGKGKVLLHTGEERLYPGNTYRVSDEVIRALEREEVTYQYTANDAGEVTVFIEGAHYEKMRVNGRESADLVWYAVF